MVRGNERKRLLTAVETLADQLETVSDGKDRAVAAAEPESEPLYRLPRAEDEELVVELRQGLARIGRLVGAGREPAGLLAALDGAELVMRAEVLFAGGRRLAAMLPSFTFLVVLPAGDRERALELAQRVEELLGGENARGSDAS